LLKRRKEALAICERKGKKKPTKLFMKEKERSLGYLLKKSYKKPKLFMKEKERSLSYLLKKRGERKTGKNKKGG
jgi:hypothetical protein